MLLWLVVVYGGTLGAAARRHLQAAADAPGVSPELYWIGAAGLLAGAGLAWRGLQALGPLLATRAERSWGLSTPVDRRGWLLPRFGTLLGAGAVAAAFGGAGFALLLVRGGGAGWVVLAGLLWGTALVASAVVAQGPGARGWWPRLGGAVTITAGVLATVVVVAAHFAGTPLVRPRVSLAPWLAVAGLPLAGASLAGALRTLPRLDVPALSAGAQLAEATLTATVWLDPSLLSGVLEARRWRRVGRVHSRPFLAVPGGRSGVLLQAELRRLVRRPGALGVWASLALVQYAVAVVAPSMAGVVRILLAYLAANRLTSGLRMVDRSPGLRRALGGDDLRLRLVHVVVPAAGTALWWLLTAPAGGGPTGSVGPLLVAGVVAAAYRAATRPPMSYESPAVETPFGLVPVELVLQLARGPDVLAGVILLRVLLGG